ncbi:hypothetical protein PoB_000249900 [Plakobranchus ocellatus]|uniref:Uncharacterized protein n=1 Tax=Plakobranchus ocellatus TaxID=259542 RepID=A0AAV3Y1A0_9GAST|nr:hypothetical protein PoB_000249900 [Plakobranchus ocellatus]
MVESSSPTFFLLVLINGTKDHFTKYCFKRIGLVFGFCISPVHKKVISGFQVFRQARALVAGLEPATCRSQVGLASHCATDALQDKWDIKNDGWNLKKSSMVGETADERMRGFKPAERIYTDGSAMNIKGESYIEWPEGAKNVQYCCH